MSKTNEEILNTFANKMLGVVEGIEAFGNEQIPEYIDQVLMYNFWVSSGLLALWCSFGSAFMYIGYKLWLRYQEEGDGDDLGFMCVFLCIGFLAIAISISETAPDMLKISLAPKVYIVDYLRANITP